MYHPEPGKYFAFIDEALGRPQVRAFGFFSEQRLAGILLLDGYEILGISVRPDLRRHGAGRSLMLRAVEALNLSQLTAETDDDSVGFYRACGFECAPFERTFPDGTCTRYRCTLIFS